MNGSNKNTVTITYMAYSHFSSSEVLLKHIVLFKITFRSLAYFPIRIEALQLPFVLQTFSQTNMQLMTMMGKMQTK